MEIQKSLGVLRRWSAQILSAHQFKDPMPVATLGMEKWSADLHCIWLLGVAETYPWLPTQSNRLPWAWVSALLHLTRYHSASPWIFPEKRNSPTSMHWNRNAKIIFFMCHQNLYSCDFHKFILCTGKTTEIWALKFASPFIFPHDKRLKDSDEPYLSLCYQLTEEWTTLLTKPVRVVVNEWITCWLTPPLQVYWSMVAY